MPTFWITTNPSDTQDSHCIKTTDTILSVSELLQEIVKSKIFTIDSVAQIESIELKGEKLKPRTRLIDLKYTEEETFVLSVKENAPAAPHHDMFGGLFGNNKNKKTKDDQKSEDNEDDENLENKKEIPKDDEFKSFSVVRKKTEETDGQESVEVTLIITDKQLRTCLRDETSLEATYEITPKINAFELNPFLDRLKDMADDYGEGSGLYELVKFLEKEFGDVQEKIKAMIEQDRISYSYLWYLFNKGKQIYGYDDDIDTLIGAEVTSYNYTTSFFGKYFSVEGKVIKSNGSKFVVSRKTFTIPFFKGTKLLKSLSLQQANDDIKKELSDRGRLFLEYGKGHHYMVYKGPIIWKTYMSVMQYKADGRCMVDIKGFSHMNPEYGHSDWLGSNSRSESNETIAEPDLWMAWPFVAGFSFTAKKWGEMLISNITPVKFDDHAYERLVLPEKKKELIQALVNNQSGTFSDIISGKGGGCIFLLHGSPGVGKTLTAESIAELLHRPLYSIGVGELGTKTDALEKKLKDILDVASTWNAVTLIDEADIFLEKRTESDVTRNALVGIFLRLLEYHQGVLFLTTNRVTNFDPAFHSRISIALMYKDLEEEERVQVWKNLLEAAEIKGLDSKSFATYELNGRQIKNSVRLAQALAKSRSKPVNKEDILETILISQQFKTDLEKSVMYHHIKEQIEKEKELKESETLKSSFGIKK